MLVNCPICSHHHTTSFHVVKDYTVSHEVFQLVRCNQCGFLFTENPPAIHEIGRYYDSAEYISHTDSKKGLFNQVYQSVRNFSIGQKLRLVQSYTNSQKGELLDFGCGTGSFLRFTKDKGWNVIGMEPDKAAREKASTLLGSSVLSPEELLHLSSNKFDVITLWHVLEHVHALHETLENFRKILNQDGILVIAVPNHASWDAKHYRHHWAAYDVPRHLYHFTPDTIHRLLTDKGFSKLGMKPMWFDSFYVSMLSEKYKTGRIRFFSGMLIGLISNINAMLQPGRCSSQIYIYKKIN
jgi:2-polyprenyl-3-methyl-5-hydroxy-6-metoxy-1,4-benzoquinol methylase